MSRSSTWKLRVRSYELDSYEHVNNTVFMQWFEHGRSHLLQDEGLDYHKIEDRWGVRMVTVAARIEYRTQLGLDDAVEIRSRVSRFGRSSIDIEQAAVQLGPDGAEAVAAEGTCTMVFTDPAMRASVPIPDEFRELYG